MSFLKMKETFETKAAIAGAPLFSSRNHLWKCTLLEKQGKHWKHVSEIPPFIFLVLFSFVKGLQSEEHLFMKNGSVSIAAVSFSAFSHPLPQPQGSPNTIAALQLWYLWEPVAQKPLEEIEQFRAWNFPTAHPQRIFTIWPERLLESSILKINCDQSYARVFVENNQHPLWTSVMSEASLPVEDNKGWCKKKLKKFGNERSIGWFERLQHIPGNLDGHIQVRAVAHPGKTWEGPDLSPLADLGLVLTENEGWGKVIHCLPGH